MGILTNSQGRSLCTWALGWALWWFLLWSGTAAAGPYAPAAGEPGSTAVSKDDTALAAWATGWEDYIMGAEVDSQWQTPQEAVGPAEGTAFNIVALGRHGAITLTFDLPIKNGEGWDFAVFENAFNDSFLELAYVQVSSDGETFIPFDSDSLTPEQTPGSVDPTNIHGLAGKYRQGYGTPFDLTDLAEREAVRNGTVNLSRISHVKIIDIVGDGSCADTSGDAIYDPYPTTGSAGFDLDALGVRYENNTPEGSNDPPNLPLLELPPDGADGVVLTPTLATGPFSDPDAGDLHLLTQWQIGRTADFSHEDDPVFELVSSASLTSMTVPGFVLSMDTTYYWRVRFYDGEAKASQWSGPSVFRTLVNDGDCDGSGSIDGLDLLCFALYFADAICSSEPACHEDLNGDGDVDGKDLAALAATFAPAP